MLIKHNPLYQLLYSPSHSLKPNEKDLLINTLTIHLKEKCHLLYKSEQLQNNTNNDLMYAREQFYQYKETMNQRVHLL